MTSQLSPVESRSFDFRSQEEKGAFSGPKRKRVLFQGTVVERIKHWSLRTLLSKLIKIGAKVVRHSRMVTFQMAEVEVSKEVMGRDVVSD